MFGKKFGFRITILTAMTLFTFSCSSSGETPLPEETYTERPSAATTMQPLEIPTVLQETQVTTSLQPTQEPVSFPLSERGPYFTGQRTYTLIDESRDDREINLKVWYPAIKQTDDKGNTISQDAIPDMTGAPYRLILTGLNSGNYIFKSHLASHGFVMVIVQHPDSYDFWDFQVVDHPKDFLFALDQIGLKKLGGLDGVIDSNHAGVTGYSGDGFISLALSGVRIDPEYYLSHCEKAPTMEPAFSEWYIRFSCNLAYKWDDFISYLGDDIPSSEDGLWKPFTDARIRAVMPMAPDGAWLFGDRGLAAENRPIFIIAPTNDEFTPYLIETKYIYEHLGSQERFMVSLVGKSHMLGFNAEQAIWMKHFATAYFGYYLQGREDYAYYFSEDFVSQVEGFAWGIYEGE